MDTVALLKGMVDANASDLHIVPQAPPTIRLNGELRPLFDKALTTADTEQIMKGLVSQQGQAEVQEIGVTDFAITLEEITGGRFRGNVFKDQKGINIALRFLPDAIPAMDDIGLPIKTIQPLLERKGGGIILVTGPTGSGKSTTLASMVDWMNMNHRSHIITIESPVEYTHPHKKCIVSQRELPLHSPDFAHAVRDSLREDPDVILIGEMRDPETIGAATTAAETGHLVLSTLHTNSAVETIHRIIDSFPLNQQSQIRAQLSTSLLAVISQRLIRVAHGSGRVACFEIMVQTSAISNMIRQDKTEQMQNALQTGKKLGMNTFDEHLLALARKGLVAKEDARKIAHDQKEFDAALSQS